MALEDGLAEFVTLDHEFCGFADSGMQGPVTAAVGADDDDRSIWGYAFFPPIAGAVEKRCGCQEVVPVTGGCGDLAFDGGSDVDDVHLLARLAVPTNAQFTGRNS
jgi:hypothetical protein